MAVHADDTATGRPATASTTGGASGSVPASAPAQLGTASSAGDGDVVSLIGKLTTQSTHLAQQQLSLVQAEIREAIDDLKIGVGAMVGAAVLGISGLGVTLMGIAYLIGEAIDNFGLATLLVGLAVLIIAGIMFASAKKKMSASNLKPERSIETAERMPDAATGHLNQTTGV